MVYGGLRFFDRAEIKNAMAYMRLAENPSDDSAFLRVVNVPARGIGAKSIENLVDFATTNGISLFESMQYIRGAAAAKFAAFKEIIDTLRVAKDEMPLPAFVDFTVEKSGLKNMYEMDPNGSERIENLQFGSRRKPGPGRTRRCSADDRTCFQRFGIRHCLYYRFGRGYVPALPKQK